ncbi:MAG: pitrilysin family protein, partial [Elusimicrobiota bacterium]
MNLLLKIAVILFAAAAPLRAEGWEEGSRLPAALNTSLEGDAMGVTIHRLGNGLTVYLSPNDQEPRIAAWIAVRAGSAHDPSDSTGMAHYLEHMLFKGSERLDTMDYAAEKAHLEKIQVLYEELFKTQDPAGRAKVYKQIDEENQLAGKYAVPNEMDKAYKSMGVRGVNAFTSRERTVYVCDLPKNRVPAWSKLEGDRFKRPVFRLFQSEIETVYEELNKRSLDDPHFALYERLHHALYGKENPYGRSVIGTVAHLKNPSLAKMYAFYERWYVPNNMAVALSGDFDRKEMLALLEAELGSWEPRPIPKRARLKFPAIKGAQRTEFKFEAEETALIAWRTVGKNHPDSDALSVLDMVMDNSAAGIVNLTLNQAQKVKHAGSYPSQFVESGAWQLYAVPKEGQTLEQAEKLLLGAVSQLKKGEFTDEDLKAIVRDFEIGAKRKLESNSSRVRQMADAFLTYDPWERRVGRLQRLRGVSKEDVLRVAKKYLGPNRVVIYRRKGKPVLPKIVKPEFTKFALDSSRESAFFKEIVSVPAEPIEPKWVKEGRDYRVKKVPSGRLYVVKNPINDLFSVSFRFERGRRHERYLCAALDLLNLAGADQTPAEALKKKFYALGVK